MGLATANRFIEEGTDHVFNTGRRKDVLDAAVAEIGEKATPIPGWCRLAALRMPGRRAEYRGLKCRQTAIRGSIVLVDCRLQTLGDRLDSDCDPVWRWRPGDSQFPAT